MLNNTDIKQLNDTAQMLLNEIYIYTTHLYNICMSECFICVYINIYIVWWTRVSM